MTVQTPVDDFSFWGSLPAKPNYEFNTTGGMGERSVRRTVDIIARICLTVLYCGGWDKSGETCDTGLVEQLSRTRVRVKRGGQRSRSKEVC